MIILDLLKTVYRFPNTRMIIKWMGTAFSKQLVITSPKWVVLPSHGNGGGSFN